MNLIICMTPLQVLIARKIIELNNDQTFVSIYLTYIDNKKHRYYYQLLSGISCNSTFVFLENNTIRERLLTFSRIVKAYNELDLFRLPIENVYLSSIDTMFVQYILSKIKFKKLFTFDDGTANVFADSEYFVQKSQSLSKLVFKRFFRIRFNTIEDVKKEVSKHYSIYPNEKNIIENVETISLFDGITYNSRHSDFKVKKIVLGQALNILISQKDYVNIINNISKFLGVDYFFPHPEEDLDFNHLFKTIDTHLVIEDYLINELQSNSDIKFELYTFFSSSILSLVKLDRVSVNIVYSKVLMDEFSSSYDFLATRGFNLINLDELS